MWRIGADDARPEATADSSNVRPACDGGREAGCAAAPPRASLARPARCHPSNQQPARLGQHAHAAAAAAAANVRRCEHIGDPLRAPDRPAASEQRDSRSEREREKQKEQAAISESRRANTNTHLHSVSKPSSPSNVQLR